MVLTGMMILVSGSARSQTETCFHEAGDRFGISPILLQAIAEQESSMRADALNKNHDGSWDVGLMQINSRWLPTLSRHGIRPEELWDPCVSVHVGAWILAHNIRKLGMTWEAVGAYNAKDPVLRMNYARQIHQRVQRLSIQPRQP